MRTEDGKIIGQCLNGEPEAFGMLVDKYKASVYALVYSKIYNFHDAQDVTQEVFLEAYRDLRTLRYRDSFLWWLYSIAYNNCRNWLRAQSKRPDSTFIEDSAPEGVERLIQTPNMENHHDNPMDETLYKALDSLPDKYREVLTLYYLGGMDSIEIAKVLCTTPSAIRQRLSRARVQLKGELIDMMGESFRQRRLDAIFTFRIVELVKRIKIDPTPSLRGLPWGLSLAAGILITLFSININLTSTDRLMYFHNLPLADSKVQRVGEYPVDIAKVSETSVISEQQGNDNGLGSIVPNMQNALFMAPQAEGGTWTKKADMLTPRWALSTSVVNGKIYAIGGGDAKNNPTSIIEEYDPVTNTWKRKSDMPTPRWRLTTSVVNGKIYAIGGEQEKNVTPVIEEYDPIKDKWEKKGKIPKQWKYHFSSIALNGKIYIVGGEPKDQVGQELEEYDPTNETWTQKANMLTARDNLSTSVVNGKIYAIGGVGMDAPWQLSIVEEYDPLTDTWTKKANMPTERYHLSTAVINDKIYAFGGINNIAPWFCSVVEEYDPATDTWIKKSDMPAERGALSVSAINDRIYVIGGYNKVNGADHVFSEVEEYNPNPKDESIQLRGKLPTTWGDIRTAMNK